MKIASMEALFSCEKEKIEKRVANRAAIFLGGSQNEIIDNSRTIKQAYNVRSRLLHGDALDKDKTPWLIKISTEIDAINRRIMNKVFFGKTEDFLQNKTDYKVYLKGLFDIQPESTDE